MIDTLTQTTAVIEIVLGVAAAVAVSSTVLALWRERRVRPQRYVYTVSTRDGRTARLETTGIATDERLVAALRDALLRDVDQRTIEPHHGSTNDASHVLERVADRAYTPLTDDIEVLYEIGAVPEDDRVTESYRSRSADPDRPLRWHEIRIRPVGEGTPSLRSIDDIPEVVAYEKANGRISQKLSLLPLGTTEGHASAAVIFKEEVDAESPRSWSFTYRLPGLWNPLREKGTDDAIYYVSGVGHSHVTSLQVSFAFPGNAESPNVVDLGRVPTMPVRHTAPDGKVTFTSTLENPKPGHYRWRLTAGRFRHVDSPKPAPDRSG